MMAMFGPEAAAEDEADRLYQQFKRDYEKLAPEAQGFLAKKMSWFLAWRAPTDAREEAKLEFEIYFPPEGGMVPAHIGRPGWIRAPAGGDAHDRGEVTERYSAPL